MVCRLVEHEDVGCFDHHAGEKNTHLFTTGEDAHLLDTIFTGKKHSAKETADISRILDLGELCQPVYDDIIGIKDLCIILREVGL